MRLTGAPGSPASPFLPFLPRFPVGPGGPGGPETLLSRLRKGIHLSAPYASFQETHVIKLTV